MAGSTAPSPRDCKPEAKWYSKRLLERLDKDPFYVRVPAGTTFYLYVTQTVDLGKATIGLSASIPPPNNPTPIHP